MPTLSLAAVGLVALLSVSPCTIEDVDFTPLEPEAEELVVALDVLPEDAAMEPAAKPPKCKACPDRPWCPCTYNGQPRISCNPCCFRSNFGPQVCFD